MIVASFHLLDFHAISTGRVVMVGLLGGLFGRGFEAVRGLIGGVTWGALEGTVMVTFVSIRVVGITVMFTSEVVFSIDTKGGRVLEGMAELLSVLKFPTVGAGGCFGLE